MIDNVALTNDPIPSSDEDEVINSYVTLEKGTHRFSLVYVKDLEYTQSNLGLFVEGPAMHRQPLHGDGSWSVNVVDMPITVNPADQPIVQRCFFDGKKEKLTYCVAVGTPGKLHYACDLSKGTLLKVWKGGFLDVTKMWKNRGVEQVAVPLESPIECNAYSLLASLPDRSAAWPEGAVLDLITFKGYTLNAEGYPTFRYTWKNDTIEDRIAPSGESDCLQRTLHFRKAAGSPAIWVQLDRSPHIEYISEGLYAVNDRSYYIRIDSNEEIKPVLRRMEDHDELLVPVGNASGLQYSIIW